MDGFLVNKGDRQHGPWSEKQCKSFLRRQVNDADETWIWHDTWDDWRLVEDLWPELAADDRTRSHAPPASKTSAPTSVAEAPPPSSVYDEVYDDVTVIATVVWLRLDEDRIGPRSPVEAKRILRGHPRAYDFTVSCAPNGEGAWRRIDEVWPIDFPPRSPEASEVEPPPRKVLPPPLPSPGADARPTPPPLPPPLPQSPTELTRPDTSNQRKQKRKARPQKNPRKPTKKPPASGSSKGPLAATQNASKALSGRVAIVAALAVPIVLGFLWRNSEHAREQEAEVTQTLQQQLTELESERDTLTKKLAKLEAENQTLKQSARYYFDLAVNKDRASTDDAGDQVAIEAYSLVVEKFPRDPLALVSSERVKELKARIQGRAQAILDAQQRVKDLLDRCTSKGKKAQKIRDASLRFNAANDVDLNRALAGTRRAKPYEDAAREAQQEGIALLDQGAPDPDGALRRALDDCMWGD